MTDADLDRRDDLFTEGGRAFEHTIKFESRLLKHLHLLYFLLQLKKPEKGTSEYL